MSLRAALLSLVLLFSAVAWAQLRTLEDGLRPLRLGAAREWNDFPEESAGSELVLRFDAQPNAGEQTLLVRHVDVKHAWRVNLNGRELGRLPTDENDITSQYAIPAKTLIAGENTLKISGTDKGPDDIRVGGIRIDPRSPGERLAEATAEIEVVDADSGQRLPCRLTITDAAGSLPHLGAVSSDRLVVRPGVIYSAEGRAKFGLPAGRYRIQAGRGFEYSLAETDCDLKPGDTITRQLKIRREVATPGLIAVDTHIHTLTYSGHGDATVDERMITIAGEGIELAVATDHNVHVDFEPAAQKTATRSYFTPVIGNEVTTKVGHFNIFPIVPPAAVVDAKETDWTKLLAAMRGTPGVEVVILNHPRNIHSEYQPFGPAHFNAATGEELQGRTLAFDAVEVVTSAALQSDLGLLYRDWFALLNRGHKLSPIGSSDAHDVNRYLLGQGRTYVRMPDDKPERVDVSAACRAIREGRVLVSMGLLVDLKVDGRHGPGATVTAGPQLSVECQVRGPHWARADRLALYANGVLVREESPVLKEGAAAPGGLQWSKTWTLDRPKHDVHLVAIATGPGIRAPFWRIPKPYQPDSLEFNPQVVGSTGAIWIDVDGDGRHTSALEYAGRLVREAAGDFGKLCEALSPYDEAVATQAASLWPGAGESLLAPAVTARLAEAAMPVKRGFAAYLAAWKASEQARAKP